LPRKHNFKDFGRLDALAGHVRLLLGLNLLGFGLAFFTLKNSVG